MSISVSKQSVCNVYKTVNNIGMSKKAIQHIVFFVLDDLGVTGSVSVNYIGDAKMQTLNKRYRGKNSTTDVLSFAAQEGDDMFFPNDDLGDIFISVKQIERQAKEYGVPYKEEATRMVVHGVLHLLGYDHIKPRDAKKMFGLQEKFVHKCI